MQVVSTCGLLVNFIGLFAIGHAHGGGGGGHSHGGGGGHSHHHGHGEEKNSNMQGVYLHVLADTLGSIGVIFSTILIALFGWHIADPLCSIFIAVMIFISVIPLLVNTANVLLLRQPADGQVTRALQAVIQLPGVEGIKRYHYWQHSNKLSCIDMHLHVNETAVEQVVRNHVTTAMKAAGVDILTVQIEKDEYAQHLAALQDSSTTMHYRGGAGTTGQSSSQKNNSLLLEDLSQTILQI